MNIIISLYNRIKCFHSTFLSDDVIARIQTDSRESYDSNSNSCFVSTRLRQGRNTTPLLLRPLTTEVKKKPGIDDTVLGLDTQNYLRDCKSYGTP